MEVSDIKKEESKQGGEQTKDKMASKQIFTMRNVGLSKKAQEQQSKNQVAKQGLSFGYCLCWGMLLQHAEDLVDTCPTGKPSRYRPSSIEAGRDELAAVRESQMADLKKFWEKLLFCQRIQDMYEEKTDELFQRSENEAYSYSRGIEASKVTNGVAKERAKKKGILKNKKNIMPSSLRTDVLSIRRRN